MKNKKCALGLVAIVAAVAGLTSCDRATVSKNGGIMTFTDANGKRVSYTAEDLLGSYQDSGSSLSTQFDKVYEVLVRNYYENSGSGKLSSLKSDATQEVLKDKQTAQTNANNNGTTYDAEFETILKANKVDNVDELWQKHLYDKEKELFESDLYDNFNLGTAAGVNGREALRDGKYFADGAEKKIFDFSDSGYGKVQDGWLQNQMPYEIRHILVKLNSGANKQYTQDKISESTKTGEGGEATKIKDVIMGLAGGEIKDGKLVSSGDNRRTFDYMSRYSDDTGSKEAFGEYSKSDVGPMTKDQNSELVHEFIYGIYAFESLYNARNKEASNPYGAANSYRIAPGLSKDAAKLPTLDTDAEVDKNLNLLNESGNEVSVYKYFKDIGIGSIPFGAAMALADAAKIETDDDGGKVNSNQEQFFPRNIIYNKYFNKHNVCVITPNAIAYNATKNYKSGEYRASWAEDKTKEKAQKLLDEIYDPTLANPKAVEKTKGVAVDQFKSLPGFEVNTTNVLPQFTDNVLTDSDGEIVLAVRAGASSYQGIHFITVRRSGLSLYGTRAVTELKDGKNITKYVENALSDVGTMNAGKIAYTVNTPSLSDYYTIHTPSSNNYPKYNNDQIMSTYVNFNVRDNVDYSQRSGWISSAIKNSFKDNISTYLFQYLVEQGQITFSNSKLESDIKNYSKIKRQSSYDSAFETWSKNWKEYAELLVAQNEARGDGRIHDINSRLISETCAVGYGLTSKNSDMWKKGGACYYASLNGNE